MIITIGQIILYLLAVFGIPQVKPVWEAMDRFAFGRVTLVKEYVITMTFIAASRTYWYLATALFGQADPTGPFVFHLGILPEAMEEFPFSFLLPHTALPAEAWVLGSVAGFGCLIYGWVGLPPEGLNRAVNVPGKIRVSLFYFGFHLLWILFALMVLPL